MTVKRYKKAMTDETLQSPPRSLYEGADPSECMPGCDVDVIIERVDGACPMNLLVGDVTNYVEVTALSNEHICPFAQYEMYQYISAMTNGVTAKELGITYEGEDGFVTCGAWGCPTCETKVVFRLHPKPLPKAFVDYAYQFMAMAEHHSTPEFFREKYSKKETIQLREDLMEEWDKAGRPLFWDKWKSESKLEDLLIKSREEGKDMGQIFEEVLQMDIYARDED